MSNALIGIDWGNSAFRAYLMTGTGEVVDTVTTAEGVLGVTDGDFDRVFEQAVRPWLDGHGDAPVIACGMVGSRQGWQEVDYLPCPVGLSELAANLAPLRTRRDRYVWLVPGIMYTDDDGIPDVARGEETQIAGCTDADDVGDRVFVLPGTHTKWALVRGDQIMRFATFMTGELFAVLSRHSILGRLMAGDDRDAGAFRHGLARARYDGQGALPKRLFSVRTLGLFDELPGTALGSYLSGLLIGAEICVARAVMNAHLDASPYPVAIVGSAELIARYAEAMRVFDIRCETLEPVGAACGLARIATAARLPGWIR